MTKWSPATGLPIFGSIIPTSTFVCARDGSTFTAMPISPAGAEGYKATQAEVDTYSVEMAEKDGWHCIEGEGWVCPGCIEEYE